MDIVKKSKKTKKDYIFAVGRRRESVARVRLYTTINADAKWGDISITKEQMLVNGMPIEHYFTGPIAKSLYIKPFNLTNTLNKFGLTIKVNGGGKNGQLTAAVHGISRVLAKHDTKKIRTTLKKAGLLTRDARTRERRKVGTGGKARRAKQSPKR